MNRYPLLAGLLLSFSAAADVSPAENLEWRFQVLLDDKPIGQHRFTLETRGDERLLTSNARFAVDFLFFNAYRYVHQATERWAGDCLRGIDSATDDNGTRYTVDGTLQNGQFVVATAQGRTELSPCVMSFAYWNPAILRQDRLLNSQTGEWVDVQVRPLGTENYLVGARQLSADRYELQAEGKRITLWYSNEDRRWLGLDALTQEGYRLSYRLLDSTVDNPERVASTGTLSR